MAETTNTTDMTIDATTETNNNLARINVKVLVKNLTGTVNITDIMLQTGDKGTLWNSHPSEVRWSFNE